MSNCQKCGMPCEGRWCRTCGVEETAPDYTDDDQDDDAECPHCGGSTSVDGVTCAQCRRVGKVLNKEMAGRDPDDEEVSA